MHIWLACSARKLPALRLGFAQGTLQAARPCPSEAWCDARVQDHRQQLAPVLVAMLQGAEEASPPGRSASLAGPCTEGVPALALAKEAIYNAVGTCAYDLHDFLDFPSWFRSALIQVQQMCLRTVTCQASPPYMLLCGPGFSKCCCFQLALHPCDCRAIPFSPAGAQCLVPGLCQLCA